jgi:hypothetical protein
MLCHRLLPHRVVARALRSSVKNESRRQANYNNKGRIAPALHKGKMRDDGLCAELLAQDAQSKNGQAEQANRRASVRPRRRECGHFPCDRSAPHR